MQNLPPQASRFVPGTNPNMAPNAVNNGDAPLNPFKVSPVAESIINKNNATANKFTSAADLMDIKTQMYPKLTVSQISENLAKAGLFSSEGKFYDVRTGEVVRMDDAKIGLEAAQGKALATNAGANAYKADVYGRTQPVIAAADATRAGADVTRAGADVSKAASYAKSVDNTGQYQSGMLGIDHEKITAAAGVAKDAKNAFTFSNGLAMDKQSMANEAEGHRLREILVSGKREDGTPLSFQDRTELKSMISSRQAGNNKYNGWTNGAGNGLNAIAAGTSQPQASSAPNGGYTGPIPNNQAEYKKMTPQQLYEYKNVYLKWRNNNK